MGLQKKKGSRPSDSSLLGLIISDQLRASTERQRPRLLARNIRTLSVTRSVAKESPYTTSVT